MSDRLVAEPVGKTGIAIRFVKDYTVGPLDQRWPPVAPRDMKACQECGGSGVLGAGSATCHVCAGIGKVNA